MNDINQMYRDLKAKSEAEKTASAAEDNNATESEAGELVLDADFFMKVASGDEASLAALEGLTKEAMEQGFDEAQINQSLLEAAEAAGVDFDQLDKIAEGETVEDEGEEDPLEMAKVAAYCEGADKAVADALESEMAKEAGVTAEDLEQYELGLAYGAGYYEKRAELDAAIEKIAGAKLDRMRAFAGRIGGHVSGAAKRVGHLVRGGDFGTEGAMNGRRAGNSLQGLRDMRGAALKSHGTRAAGALAAGGVGVGARQAYVRVKGNKKSR